jgi:hypothetical protein
MCAEQVVLPTQKSRWLELLFSTPAVSVCSQHRKNLHASVLQAQKLNKAHQRGSHQPCCMHTPQLTLLLVIVGLKVLTLLTRWCSALLPLRSYSTLPPARPPCRLWATTLHPHGAPSEYQRCFTFLLEFCIHTTTSHPSVETVQHSSSTARCFNALQALLLAQVWCW